MVEHLRQWVQESVVHGRSSGSYVVWVRKQGLSLKWQGKIYQCCVRPVLLYCWKTWKLTVADEARLRGMERRMIRVMCGVRHATCWLIGRRLIFFVIEGGCCCEDWGYDISKSSAVVWSCHTWRHQCFRYVRIWKFKQLGKGGRVDQGNREKSV